VDGKDERQRYALRGSRWTTGLKKNRKSFPVQVTLHCGEGGGGGEGGGKA